MPRYDVDLVKQAAAGRWPEIISLLGRVDESILDGQHHPCPKCGGKDRFNLSREGTGGAFCNHCFTSKNGDGLATIQWLTGQDFATVLEAVANHVGVAPLKGKRKADPAEHLEWLPWNRVAVALWAQTKTPIKAAAVQAVGGRLARYRGEYTVIAIPVWGPSLAAADPVGWVLYRQDGSKLPKWSAGQKTPDWVKVKLTAGSSKGLIMATESCSALADKNNALANSSTTAAKPAAGQPPVTYWKTEGPSDLLAFLSADWPDGHIPFTTANGATEKPADWIVELFAGQMINVIHDADQPGQQGATYVEQRDGQRRAGWCPTLATRAADVRNVTLPYPIEPNHGSDLRDYFAGGGTVQTLLERAGEARPFNAKPTDAHAVEEHEDDPQRLARVNLRKYHDDHGGRLVFWRDEWWKYKAGRYRRIEQGELKAKVWAAVRAEFEACWRERRATGDDKPVRKVTRALVSNVVGAMESMVTLPSSVPMPCWLPDRSQPHYLALENGILDLKAVFERRSSDQCLLPLSPDWFSSFRLNYAFDHKADCPQWRDYLDYAMEGDQERIAILQEWAGYLLTSSNDLQRFLVLEGEGGNGKTVYFAAITAMLGEDNVAHVSIENFGGRFELGTTIGKAANISGDAGEIDQVAEGVLKQFTGGDIMQFDRKNLQPISARPTAKLMAAWNTRPRIKDRSQGLWRRMLLVPFKRPVDPGRRVLGMDRPQWWLDEGEAPGILLWAITGLYRLNQQSEFTRSKVSQEAMHDYRKDSNPAAEFFADYIEAGETGRIESARLYDLYQYWCRKTGCKPLGNRQFGKELRRAFPNVDRKRIRDGRKLLWEYDGIQFSSDEILSEPVDRVSSLF